jgi:hypothetical protein
MLPIQEKIFRPPRWIFIFLIGMCAAYGIILIEQQEMRKNEYGIVFFGVIVCAYSIASIKRTMIRIDNDGILDRKVFSQTHIKWKEIISADITVNSHTHGISFSWVFERTNKRAYKMHVPRRKYFNDLTEALVMKAPQARLSDKIISLSEGKKTSIIF